MPLSGYCLIFFCWVEMWLSGISGLERVYNRITSRLSKKLCLITGGTYICMFIINHHVHNKRCTVEHSVVIILDFGCLSHTVEQTLFCVSACAVCSVMAVGYCRIL